MFMGKKHYKKAGDDLIGGKKRPTLQVPGGTCVEE